MPRSDPSRRLRIRIYSKKDCHLCDEAKTILVNFASRYPITVEEIDIGQDAASFEKYRNEIPVIFLENRKLFKYRIDAKKLDRAIRKHLC